MKKGQKMTDEQKAKISKGNLGKVRSKEDRQKLSLSRMGDKNPKYWLGKKRSEETKLKISNSVSKLRGEQASAWKGDKAGYSALHYWIAKELGKPKLCSNCGFSSNNGRQFHRANISYEYRRKTDDWARLCVKCHMAYDMGKIAL